MEAGRDGAGRGQTQPCQHHITASACWVPAHQPTPPAAPPRHAQKTPTGHACLVGQLVVARRAELHRQPASGGLQRGGAGATAVHIGACYWQSCEQLLLQRSGLPARARMHSADSGCLQAKAHALGSQRRLQATVAHSTALAHHLPPLAGVLLLPALEPPPAQQRVVGQVHGGAAVARVDERVQRDALRTRGRRSSAGCRRAGPPADARSTGVQAGGKQAGASKPPVPPVPPVVGGRPGPLLLAPWAAASPAAC